MKNRGSVEQTERNRRTRVKLYTCCSGMRVCSWLIICRLVRTVHPVASVRPLARNLDVDRSLRDAVNLLPMLQRLAPERGTV